MHSSRTPHLLRLLREVFASLLLAYLFGADAGLGADNPTNAAPRWPALKEVLEKWQATPMQAIELAAEGGDLTAQHYLGYCLTEGFRFQQDSAKGTAWYQRAGKAGYMPSFNNLGYLYVRGKGVPQDYAKALYFFKLAADGGFLMAQVAMGGLYRDGLGVRRDTAQAMRWFQRAADQGDARAMFNLYRAYWDGEFVAADFAKAMSWLTQAAEAGDATAQCELGFRNHYPTFDQSRPLRLDATQAVKWFRLAADQGHAGAQYYLGICYLGGEGVEQDEQRGLDLIRQAADQDLAEALLKLEALYAAGVGEPRSLQDQPIQLLQRVVQSDPNREWAYERIVFRYVYGVGVDCDLAAAVEWYCRGVLAGADGTFFKNGLDIDPNRNLPIATYGGGAERPLINFVLPDRGQLNGRFVAVLTLYLKAARTNDPKALMQIGEMYLAGRGAPVSAAKAWPWLTLAAQRGDATAGAKLANIESKMTKDELNDARQTLPALAQRLKAVASAAGHLKIESKNLGPTAM